MPGWLAGILPGILAGIFSALGSVGAIKATVKSLGLRVERLEQSSLDLQRTLGRVEGRQEMADK